MRFPSVPSYVSPPFSRHRWIGLCLFVCLGNSIAAQSCPDSEVKWLNSGLLVFNYNTVGEAGATLDALKPTGTSVALDGSIQGGNNSGTAFLYDLSRPQLDLGDRPSLIDGRFRPALVADGQNTFNGTGEAAAFSGTVTLSLASGDALTCTYDVGAFVTSNVTLPAVLTSFTLRPENRFPTLEWTTAEETGLSHFIVQHSPNGSQWTDREQLQPRPDGNGTGRYTFRDKFVGPGSHYYRLKLVDLDGQFAFSDVVRGWVGASRAEDLEVMPTLVLPGQSLRVNLAGLSDRRHHRLNIVRTDGGAFTEIFRRGGTTHRLDVFALPAGVYVIHTGAPGSTFRKGRFVIAGH